MGTTTVERGRSPSEAARELARATVGVLMGGRSTEREVSLSSGRQVLAALGEATDAADLRGPGRVIPVEILASGRWRVAGKQERDKAGVHPRLSWKRCSVNNNPADSLPFTPHEVFPLPYFL